MKHTDAAEDYANRSQTEIEIVFTKFNLIFNRNFNFNSKIETISAVKSLT
jgi:hypothetical protein